MAEADEKLPRGRSLIPSFSQAFLQNWLLQLWRTWSVLTHSPAIWRRILKWAPQNLDTGIRLTVVQRQLPEREEKINGGGNCFSGWDLKRALLEKQMQKAPLSKSSRWPEGSLWESCWEAFLNQQRQQDMLILWHNCVGYSLKKHLEPARCSNLDREIPEKSGMFFTSTIYSLQKITYSLHATLKSTVAGFVTPIGGAGRELK